EGGDVIATDPEGEQGIELVEAQLLLRTRGAAHRGDVLAVVDGGELRVGRDRSGQLHDPGPVQDAARTGEGAGEGEADRRHRVVGPEVVLAQRLIPHHACAVVGRARAVRGGGGGCRGR